MSSAVTASVSDNDDGGSPSSKCVAPPPTTLGHFAMVRVGEVTTLDFVEHEGPVPQHSIPSSTSPRTQKNVPPSPVARDSFSPARPLLG